MVKIRNIEKLVIELDSYNNRICHINLPCEKLKNVVKKMTDAVIGNTLRFVEKTG